MIEKSERELLAETVQRLEGRFPQLSGGLIATAVDDAHEHFEQSRVRDFVLLLVERRAHDELALLAANPDLSIELVPA
jgi:hypothetical protein